MNLILSRRGMLLGAGTVIAASGCASKASTKSTTTTSSGPAAAANAADTITVMGYAGEHSKEALAAFTKQSGVKVNLVEYTYDKLVAMLAAGNAPDVVRGYGATDTPFLYTKKLAEPLEPYVDKSQVIKKDDLGQINDLWRFNGQKQGEGDLLGLVKDYSSDCTLWINKDLVPGVGEGEVLTYDRVKQLALAATKSEGGRVKTYGYDFYDQKPNIQLINAMCRSAGREIWSSDFATIDLTSNEAVQALQFVRDLVEAKATISSFNKSTISAPDLFKAGRLAIFQSGYWSQGMWGDVKPDISKNFRMLPAPQMGGQRISPVLSGAGMWMPAASKKKDAAWKFMEDFFGGQPAKDRASSGWGVPALKSLTPSMPTKTAINKQALSCQKGEDKYFNVLNFTPYAKVDGVQSALSRAFDQGIQKKSSTNDIAAEATKLINELLSRGKR